MSESLESFSDCSWYTPGCSRESGNEEGRGEKTQGHMQTPGLGKRLHSAGCYYTAHYGHRQLQKAKDI